MERTKTRQEGQLKLRGSCIKSFYSGPRCPNSIREIGTGLLKLDWADSPTISNDVYFAFINVVGPHFLSTIAMWDGFSIVKEYVKNSKCVGDTVVW